MNYRVKFYFVGDSAPADVTMFDRSEDMAELCQHLVKSQYQTFIEGKKGSVTVSMSNVTKIEIQEV